MSSVIVHFSTACDSLAFGRYNGSAASDACAD